MAILLRKQLDSEVTNPAEASQVKLYVDEDGNPKLKTSTGAVVPAAHITGSPLSLTNQVSAPSTEANKSKIYAKDVSGNSEFFVLDGSGNEVQVTSAGAVTVPPGDPSTWFANGQIYEHDITYTGGSGLVSQDTGIVMPSSTANQLVMVYLQSNLVSTGGAGGVGWANYQTSWSTIPSLPFSLVGAPDASTNFSNPYSAIVINASGNLEVSLNSIESYRGSVLIAMHATTLTGL